MVWMRAALVGVALSIIAPPILEPAMAAEPKTLKVASPADLAVLDPVFVPIVITREYATMVYEELFAWDSKMQSKPQMVGDWSTSPDGLTWRFTLRDGLKFHDGQPVTTADVIPSLQRWMNLDLVGAKLKAQLVSLDPVDAKTFTLVVKKPYPAMLFSLGSGVGQLPVIMRAKDIADPTLRVNTTVGSGPFRFNQAERISGARSVFERNTDYVPRTEPPDGLTGARIVKLDRVEWLVLPDASTAAAALQSGEIDMWEQPALDLVPLLAKNPNIKLQKLTDLASTVMLRPNSLYPPFNTTAGRLALAYIIDQGDVLAGGFGDPAYWQRCNSYFVCGGPYGTTVGTEDFHQDFAKARALLAEAGYHGEKLLFPSTNDYPWMGHMAEVMVDEMKKAGMNVEIIWGDWGTTGARVSKQDPPDAGGWNLFTTGASGATMSQPLTNIGTNMACDRKGMAGWPCDPHAEELRQAFLDANDAERPAALDRLHRYLAQVQPYRVLGQYSIPVAMRTNITGMLTSPSMVYWNIDKN